MRTQPTLKDWMTPFPTSVSETTSVRDAKALMQQKGVHHLPVLQEHHIVGLVSLAALDAADLRQHDDHNAPLMTGDVCQRDVVCVDINTRVDEVLALMTENDQLSVMITRQGRMAGILTCRDVLSHTAHLIHTLYFSDRSHDLA